MNEGSEGSQTWVAQRLPWAIGLIGLVVYSLTACRWLNHLNLGVVTQLGDWHWDLPSNFPLLYLVTRPLLLLPIGLFPIALNLFTAVMAALVLVQLARCVALLPHDRTHEQRIRNHTSEPLLHIPLGWVPQVFACAMLGLQLTFWQHATAITGEMLDLLVFAFCVRALLEYRNGLNERWMWASALVFGMGMTNNWALIGFLPLFVLSIAWIRGLSFFSAEFLLKMAGLGLVGLTLYLLMPIVMSSSGRGGGSFVLDLKATLSAQKEVLVSKRRGPAFLFGLVTLFPLLLAAVRWPSTRGTSVEKAITSLALHLLQLAFVAAIVVLCFDLPEFSTRGRLTGVQFLTFLFLGALAVGYSAGFFLLVYGQKPSRDAFRSRSVMSALSPIVAGIVLIGAVAVPVGLAYRNYHSVQDNGVLDGFARALFSEMPQGRKLVLADQTALVQLAEAQVRRDPEQRETMIVSTRLADYALYRSYLMRRHGSQWEALKNWPDSGVNARTILMNQALLAAQDGRAYYLEPSFGVFFEVIQTQPVGIAQRIQPYAEGEVSPTPLAAEDVQKFSREWDRLDALVQTVAMASSNSVASQFVGSLLGRSANASGVALQRSGHFQEATAMFGRALKANPENLAAKVNLDVNSALVAGQSIPTNVSQILHPYSAASILKSYGPVDEPWFLTQWGESCTTSGDDLLRQAVDALSRASELRPKDPNIRLAAARAWLAADYLDKATDIANQARSNLASSQISPALVADFAQIQSAALVKKGDLAGGIRILEDTLRLQPENTFLLDTASYLLLRMNQLPRAQELVERWAKLGSDDPQVLSRLALVQMGQKEFTKAADNLTRVLFRQPENDAARMNRAICRLQLQNWEEASKDYSELEKRHPDLAPVQFGLGEIAWQNSNKTNALKHYESYLKLAPRESSEYTNVLNRIQQIRSG